MTFHCVALQVKIDRRGPKQRPVFFNQIVAVFEGWNDSRNNGARALTDSRGQVRCLLRSCEKDDDVAFSMCTPLAHLNVVGSTWIPTRLHLLPALLMTRVSHSSGTRHVFCFNPNRVPVLNFTEQGDVILIDNLTVMHSRQTFVPPRRTLARCVLLCSAQRFLQLTSSLLNPSPLLTP